MDEKIKKRKKGIFEKMKKIQVERETSESNFQAPNVKSDHHPQKNWKNLYKKKAKELESCRKDKIQLSNELKELHKQIASLKKENYEKHLAFTASISANKGLEIENEQLSKALLEKDSLINTLNEQKLLTEMEHLEKEIKRLREVNSKLKSQQGSYKNEIASLNEKLATLSVLSQDEQDEKMTHLNQVNLNLSNELKAYKEKLNTAELELHELKLMLDVEQLISVIVTKLKYDSLDKFAKLDDLMKRIRLMRRVKQKRKYKSLYRVRPQDQGKEPIQYGYLCEREGRFWFSCLSSNEIYRVGGNPMLLKSDMPASAIIRNDWANVIDIYQEFEEPRSDKKELKKHPASPEDISQQDNQGRSLIGIKVLILGSRNLVKYRDSLEKYGSIVEINNPFEDSIELRRGAFTRADVVIICTSHVPHNMLSPTELSDKKVELIERDNINSIVARVRFAALRLHIKLVNNSNDLGTAP